MTRDEFNNTKFTANTTALKDGEWHPVVMIDFEEAILGLDMFNDSDNLSYVRCESVEVSPF